MAQEKKRYTMLKRGLIVASNRLGTDGRRRGMRLFTLLFNPLLVFAVYWLNAVTMHLEVSNYFDSHAQFVIETRGCSVEVIPCQPDLCSRTLQGSQMGQVTVKRNLVKSTSSKVFRTGTETLEYLTVDSSVNCLKFHGRKCKPSCYIQVSVPEANKLHLRVNQIQSDRNSISSLKVFPGVSLDYLSVNGAAISVELEGVRLVTGARVSSGSRRIQAINSRLGNALLTASQSNVRVVYGNDTDVELVQIDHRSTTYDSKTCVLGPKVFHEPIEDTIATCTTGRYLQRLQSTFDKDLNGRVTTNEFDEGVESLSKCCGSSCPSRNLCSWSLTPAFVDFGESFVSLSKLYDNVRLNMDYSVIPMCTRRSLVARDPTLNLTDATQLKKVAEKDELTIRTDMGGIQVLLWNETLQLDAEPSDEEDLSADLALTAASAKDIEEKIRDVYASGPINRETNPNVNDIFAVFTVDYGPYCGQANESREFRFVYTNAHLYLTILPPFMKTYTMGILGPDVVQHNIDLVAPGCKTRNETVTVEEIGKAIFNVLLPRFRTSLYGVLVSHMEDPETGQVERLQFTLDPASGKILAYNYDRKDGRGSLYVSFAIGGIVSLVILSKFSVIMHIQMQKRRRTDEARDKVMLWRGKSDPSCKFEPQKGISNYFENPVELFDVLFVDSFRRQFSDSLTMFINRTYHVKTRKSTQESSHIWCWEKRSAEIMPDDTLLGRNQKRIADAVTLSEFLVEYEKFCFDRRLDMVDDINKVKKRLLLEKGVRTRGIIADRVYGCRWRTLEEVEAFISPALQKRGFDEPLQVGEAPKANRPRTAPSFDYDYVIEKAGLLARMEQALQSALPSQPAEITLEGNLQQQQQPQQQQQKNMRKETLLRLFVETFLVQTGNIRDFVAFDNPQSRDGKELVGFQRAFRLFVDAIRGKTESKQEESADLSAEDSQLDDVLIGNVGLERRQVRLENMNGLIPIKKTSEAEQAELRQVYSCRWYALVYFETSIHQLAFAAGPVFILQAVLTIQFNYGNSVGPSGSFQLEDFISLPVARNLEDLYVLGIVKACAYGCLVMVVSCYILLAFVYMDATSNPMLLQVIRKGYALVFSFSLFILLCFCTVQCVWVLLAAFLHPTKLLPFGASVGCFFTIISYQYNRITSVRTKWARVFNEVFNERMKQRILQAMALKRKTMQGGEEGLLAISEKDSNYTFDPNDLFNLIDTEISTPEVLTDPNQALSSSTHSTGALAARETGKGQPGGAVKNPEDGDDRLSRMEFEQLFDTLGINVLPKKRDMLFALCDTSSNYDSTPDGYVSREEFLEAWDFLVEEINSSIIRGSLGLSSFQVALYLVSLGLVLVLLFAFLLLTASAFETEGSIAALIQSMLIAGATSASATASNAFGAAASASNLSTSVDLEKLVGKEVDDRIEPEVETSHA